MIGSPHSFSYFVGEIIGRKLAQITAIRPEVVVDHIEDHAQAERVRAIDEVRASRPARRRARVGANEIDAVVAPAEAPGEIRHRHHLEQRDAEIAPAPASCSAAARQVPSCVKVPMCIS